MDFGPVFCQYLIRTGIYDINNLILYTDMEKVVCLRNQKCRSIETYAIVCTLDRYTLYPHQYFWLFLGPSHQKDPGLRFLCIFLIIGWTYRYTVRMSTFGNYECACNDCWALTTSNLQICSFWRMSRRVGALCNCHCGFRQLAKCSYTTAHPSEGADL